MTAVMVDTSVWIDYFRGQRGAKTDLLDSLLEADRVVLCGVVEMELLRGVRAHERKRLRDLLTALPYVDTGRLEFTAAGERLCRLREDGVTIPATDALIAAVCKANNLDLLTTDAHFRHFKDVKQVDK